MSQLKVVRQEEFPLTCVRASFFFTFRPSARLDEGYPLSGGQSVLFSLLIQMFISSRNILTNILRMFDQICRHSVAQSS